MLLALKRIREMEHILKNKSELGEIIDYRLALKFDMEIKGYILVENEKKETALPKVEDGEKIEFEVITKNDYEDDSYYKYLFEENTEKVDLSLRRRYDNLFESIEERKPSPCPVITFYSYKGGVGRSTALASFAAHYAMHRKKSVIIIDCDLEAPGFTNFFDVTTEIFAQEGFKGGLVEYLSNKEFSGKIQDINSYLIEISEKYSGDGKIYLMPAGNTTDESVFEADSENCDKHIIHYLEGLSRLNLAQPKLIIEQFQDLLKDIYDKIKPDIVLIDSRTGFNDILANIGFSLSDLIIGFFSMNRQTEPGLHFFLEKAAHEKMSVILVNSILPYETLFEEFDKTIENFFKSNPVFRDYYISQFPIGRDIGLEVLGTSMEPKDFFVNMIKKRNFRFYNELFSGIEDWLQQKQSMVSYKEGDSESTQKDADLSECRKKLINNLIKNFPEPYAKEITDDFLEKQFYFRECMKDILNRDKILIMGGKGTGKTLLYNALQNDKFIRKIRQRSGKTDHYVFVNIISLKEDANPVKFIDVAARFPVSEIKDSDYFFTRFWIVYIWNAILIEEGETFGFTSHYKIEAIRNDAATAKRFQDYIKSDEHFHNIEAELNRIDSYLTEKNMNLIIAFDRLDNVVKPLYWSKGIAPLINFWRSNPFSRIMPKLFIRTDLFRKLENMTNKPELKKRAISIEWSKEELFAFFFKIVFTYSKKEFFKIMDNSENEMKKQRSMGYSKALILEIRQATDSDHQIPLEEKYLRPMVEVFFGKWSDPRLGPIKGESYEWIYRNLKNADDTINLRPFLDMMKEAMINYSKKKKDGRFFPVLPPSYYTHFNVRQKAVEEHFQSLAEEDGNGDLKKLFEYIEKAPAYLRTVYIKQRVFIKLINDFIKKYKDKGLEHRTFDELKELLIINGIIAPVEKERYVDYVFAYLYQCYLKLE